jgi:uncharacterized protein GlcG (DUF336 family)
VAQGKLLFRERDVSRAVRACAKAGIEVARVLIDKSGTIQVIARSEDYAPRTKEMPRGARQ